MPAVAEWCLRGSVIADTAFVGGVGRMMTNNVRVMSAVDEDEDIYGAPFGCNQQ